MNVTARTDIPKAWNRFLQEVELAKHYHSPYILIGFGDTFRNPLLDDLLPSLLYVKMVAILDEALVIFIRDKGLTVPKKYQKSLHGRIEYLKDQAEIASYTALHDVRDLRNLLAHEISENTTWDNLSTDLDTVESELQHLGIVGDRPDYRYFGERSAMRNCDEPGVICAQDFRFGIKSDDRIALEFSFTRKTYNDPE